MIAVVLSWNFAWGWAAGMVVCIAIHWAYRRWPER